MAMQSFLLLMTVSLMTASLSLQAAVKGEDTTQGNVKTLNYHSSVDEIVKDLIAAWNSPLVYLRNRGYLASPQSGIDMLLPETNKDSKKVHRVARSQDDDSPNDLSQLFRTLFSANGDNVSDKIKSKLGVPWDMNALKNSVRNEALKLYEKFYDRHSAEPSNEEVKGDTDIERQVAQLYPSVVLLPNKDKVAEEEQKSVSETSHLKEPKLTGIAKLLISRTKTLPADLKDQNDAIQETSKNTV